MTFISSNPDHRPGFQPFRNLKSFTCRCSGCGSTNEIFSDEFDREHRCPGCGNVLAYDRCEPEGEARSTEPE